MSIRYYTDEELAEQLYLLKRQITEKDVIIADLLAKINSLEKSLGLLRSEKFLELDKVKELKNLNAQ